VVEIIAGAECVPAAEVIEVAVKIVGAAAGDTSMMAPLLRPNSGAKLLVSTRNSSVESGFCVVTPPSGPGTSASLLSVPSSMKLLLRSRAPLTETPAAPLSDCVTPGPSSTS